MRLNRQLQYLRPDLPKPQYGVVADDSPVLRYVPSKTPRQLQAEARHRELVRQHLDGSLWRGEALRPSHG